MSQAIATSEPPAIAAPPPTAATPALSRQRFIRKRWTIAQFDAMLTHGLLREGGKTFLWDGEVLTPMPEDPAHWNTCEALRDLLPERFTAAEFIVNTGRPLNLVEYYKPQPDLLVLRGPRTSWKGRTPVPADVVLLIEVSNTSYKDDVGEMLREYARAGISQYWIVDIPGRRIEAHLRPDPEAGTYAENNAYGLDQSVPLLVEIDGQPRDLGAIDVREVLAHSIGPDTPPHA